MKENKIIKVFSLVVVVHLALVAMLVLQPGCNTVSGSGKTAMASPVGSPYDSGLWDNGPERAVQPAVKANAAANRTASSTAVRSAKTRTAPVQEAIVDLSGVAEFENASVYSEHHQHYSYTVKAGDSVWKIANANGVSMRKLMEMNNLTQNSRIHPGQTLMIPGVQDASAALAQLEVPRVSESSRTTAPATVNAPASETVVAKQAIPEMKAPQPKTTPVRETVLASASLTPSSASIPMDESEGVYDVQPGDSLYLIAMHNNTTVEAIRELNGMDKNLIKPGQQLRIPGKFQGNPVTPSRTDSSFEVAFNDVPVAPGTADHLTHEVAPGEYPGLIARKYNMSLTDLLELNRIQNPRMLRVGTKLKVINPEAMMQRTEVAAESTQEAEGSVASRTEGSADSESDSAVSTINFDDFPVIRVGS